MNTNKPRALALHELLKSKRHAVHKTAKRPSRQQLNKLVRG